MNYIICDLDGCLSDDRKRRVLLPSYPIQGPEEYDAYHRECLHDPSNEKVIDDILYDAGVVSESDARILYATARPDRFDFRVKTLGWIRGTRIGHIPFTLLMRPSEDRSGSVELKMHLLNSFFEGLHGDAWRGWRRVLAAYDDRQDVLAAYPLSIQTRRLVTL